MSRKRTGWQKQHMVKWASGPDAMRIVLNLQAEQYAPSTWDRLLHDLHISEANVLAEVRTRTSAGRAIRAWIDCNQHKLFVPEVVLRAMGISTWS